jgi:hypothetical protein
MLIHVAHLTCTYKPRNTPDIIYFHIAVHIQHTHLYLAISVIEHVYMRHELTQKRHKWYNHSPITRQALLTPRRHKVSIIHTTNIRKAITRILTFWKEQIKCDFNYYSVTPSLTALDPTCTFFTTFHPNALFWHHSFAQICWTKQDTQFLPPLVSLGPCPN